MDKEKIGDFIDVWADTLGLKDKKYINLIKNDIYKRYLMYSSSFSSISIIDDDNPAYIIKPVNGEYSLVDFFLNRLMLGLREIGFDDTLENNSGEYVSADKALNVSVQKIYDFVADKVKRHKGLEGKAGKIAKKTIEHELGHCLKSTFSKGFKAALGLGREQDELYKQLIKNLRSYKNGKYASQLKTFSEVYSEEESRSVKTGVSHGSSLYGGDYRFTLIDELLNETEALQLTESTEVHERWALQVNGKDSPSGNYVNVRNYISAYSTFTGYGPILKALFGKEDAFRAEYLTSEDVFRKFDAEYADIAREVWNFDAKVPPMRCLFISFNYLLREAYYDEETMLLLDEFLAKCYKRKIEKMMASKKSMLSDDEKDLILQEIEQFQKCLTTNDDPKKRSQLVHNVIFEEIKNMVLNNTYTVESSEQTQKNETDEHSRKRKFIEGFIQAYNDTETEYLYQRRNEFELSDIKRVLEIIKMNGMNFTLLEDLRGRLITQPGSDNFVTEYSQKQVSAMAQLLMAAKLLTESKRFNPNGIDYLEAFSNVPNIDYILKQMRGDLKNNESYMHRMREQARDNRNKGNTSSFPPTEIEAMVLMEKSHKATIQNITQPRPDQIDKVSKAIAAAIEQLERRVVDLEDLENAKAK